MSDNTGYLVVGGDSFVGDGVVRALTRRGHRGIATSRRRETIGPDRIFLDFENDEPFHVPKHVQYAFIIAAATNYERCETDPNAHVINVELIPKLICSLLEQGVFVTFISTNSVFGGERPWPHENDAHDPGIAYARQKSEGESVVVAGAERLGLLDRLNIVRLTKILGPDVSPLPSWLPSWSKGEGIEPFTDLVFAPMSVDFVSDSLVTIGEKRISGNLHLSGAQNVNYVDLAQSLARRLQLDASLIRPTTAVEKGIHIPYKPSYSGLGMTRTTELTGIAPQPLDAVVDDMFPSTTA